jgi:23S rRNA 5-hydroxycytidine C2501 synthase
MKTIRERTKVELEFFIHGALCVCFSGQCYMSQAAQGRSANRGECAQPCRLPYTLLDGNGTILAENKYLLSLRDLNLTDHLRELIDQGITSFKIEGRLKDIDYVKNVTAFYRQRLDEIIGSGSEWIPASSGKMLFDFQPDPAKTFNRGFTNHFVRKRNRDILALLTPKSQGALLGTVVNRGTYYLTLDSDIKMHAGDGICYFDADDILQGTNINKVIGKKIFPNELGGIDTGTILYRNYDHIFSKTLQLDHTQRRIPITMTVKETESGIELQLSDVDGVSASASLTIEKTLAKDSKKAGETMQKQLMKLGETPFVCTELKYKLRHRYFLPIGGWNELRRHAVEALEAQRRLKYPRRLVSFVKSSVPYPEKHLDYHYNVANNKARKFYRDHGVEEIDDAFERNSNHKGAVLMTTKHCLRFQFGICAGAEAVNVDPLFLSDKHRTYRLEFDCQQCQMRIILSEHK